VATRFTFDQLKQLWVQAGGNPQYADMAAAVALAESGGDPTSTNVNTGGSAPGSVDKGLWQINNYYHPAQSTYDPLSNARGAVQISQNGTNWRPWCTAYSDGRCGGTFLGAGSPVLKYLPSGASTGTAPANPSSASDTGVILPGGGYLPIPGPTIDLPKILGAGLNALGIQTPDQAASDLLTWIGLRIYWTFLILLGVLGTLVALVLLIVGSRPVKAAGRAVLGLAAPPVVNRRITQGGPAQRARARAAAEQPPVFNIFTGTDAPASGGPVSAAPVTPAPPPAPAPPAPPRRPRTSYKPRHYLLFDEGNPEQVFRSGEPRKRRKAARTATRGKDEPPGRPGVFTVGGAPTKGYQGRRRAE